MRVMARSAKGREGTQRAQRTLECAELVWCLVWCCVWWFWVVVLGDTPALVVGLLIALSVDAINQLPIASVYGPQDNRVWERT